MLGMAPDYDHLPVINKVEVFEYALDSTSGEDLHKVGRQREGRVLVLVRPHKRRVVERYLLPAWCASLNLTACTGTQLPRKVARQLYIVCVGTFLCAPSSACYLWHWSAPQPRYLVWSIVHVSPPPPVLLWYWASFAVLGPESQQLDIT